MFGAELRPGGTVLLLEWSQESLLHGPGGFAPEGGGKQAAHGRVGNGSRSGCQGAAQQVRQQEKRQELSENPRRQGGPGIKTCALGR